MREKGEMTAMDPEVDLAEAGVEPDVGLRRLLDDEGHPIAEVGVEDAALARVFEQMVRLRVLDDRALNLQRQGRISFYAPCGGQEAAIVASAAALGPDDWCFPSFREVGVLLTRGLSMRSVLDQLYGNATDLVKGRQMPNHFAAHHLKVVSISSCIATQNPQAAGLGMAQRIRGERAATLCYFGDGATSEGDFHAGLNFAGVYRAHTVFFCQNNQWAITVPVEQQTASRSIAIKARAYGFDGIRIDGNDAAVVYRTMRDALARAAEGRGPTLIEALTYRMGPHSTSDDPRRYRPEDAAGVWQGRDPIERLERYLLSRDAIGAETRAEHEARAQEEVTAAIEGAEREAAPAPETLFTDIYAEPTARLRAQSEELRDLMARGVVKPLRGFGLGGH